MNGRDLFPNHSTRPRRLLMLAPHPDDESIAAGGLLQKAAASGAQIPVLFATSGESNPWPQRVAYRKWGISNQDRARWGETRREESRQALIRLGVPASAARFLDLPDQGITRLLMRRPEAVQQRLARYFGEWSPDVLLLPASADIHRDHNALAILSRQALAESNLSERPVLEYIVHGRPIQKRPGATSVVLSGVEQERKRQAILAHRTQMTLSEKRFLSYVRPVETFRSPDTAEFRTDEQPIRSGVVEGSSIRLEIQLPLSVRTAGPVSLMLALQTIEGESVRWTMKLPRSEGVAPMFNTVHERDHRSAAVRRAGGTILVRVPLGGASVTRAHAKLHFHVGFHDWAGWRALSVADCFEPSAPAACLLPLLSDSWLG